MALGSFSTSSISMLNSRFMRSNVAMAVFLTPRSALSVQVNNETGEVQMGGIWDYRDDPEGIRFADLGPVDVERAVKVAREQEKRAVDRILGLGYVVQPLPKG